MILTIRHSFFASLAGLILLVPSEPCAAASAVSLDGVNDHIRILHSSALDLPQFTLECWFKKTGAGVTATTGTSGVTAIPLIAKGRKEDGGANTDTNYFLGIRQSDNKLVADFEESVSGANPGTNYPLIGKTAITNNTWNHAALSYDGMTMKLYLNGKLDNQLFVGQPVQTATTQPVGVGTVFSIAGVAAGAFQGLIDEVRIWNTARGPQEIGLDYPLLAEFCPNLVVALHCDEGSGTVLTNHCTVPLTIELRNGAAWTSSVAPIEHPVSAPRIVARGGEPPPSLTRHGLQLNETGSAEFAKTTDNLASSPINLVDSMTVECLFKVSSFANSVTTSATGGNTDLIPLVTKGREDTADSAATNVTFFLGVKKTSKVLFGGFENSGSINHFVTAPANPVTEGCVAHAAMTYDKTTGVLRLFLNGLQVGTSTVTPGPTPNQSSTNLVGIGTAFSGTVNQGSISGAIDEVRIWSRARSAAEVLAGIGQYDPTEASDVIARWTFDEGPKYRKAFEDQQETGNGTNVTVHSNNTSGFFAPDPDAQPTKNLTLSTLSAWGSNLNEPGGMTLTETPQEARPDIVNLQVEATGPPSSSGRVNIFAGPSTAPPPFTVAFIPDTQTYVDPAQTSTAVRRRDLLAKQFDFMRTRAAGAGGSDFSLGDGTFGGRILFVSHCGDITENGEFNTTTINNGTWNVDTGEWNILRHCFNRLHAAFNSDFSTNPLPVNGDEVKIPYGVSPGNHDVDRANGNSLKYNTFFGPQTISHVSSGQPVNNWHAGYLGSNSAHLVLDSAEATTLNTRTGFTHNVSDMTTVRDHFFPSGVANESRRNSVCNYELFEVGTIPFIVLHIDLGLPRYALVWARNVLNAHKDRIAIITTHAFLTQGGEVEDGDPPLSFRQNPPGGTTGEFIVPGPLNVGVNPDDAWAHYLSDFPNILIVANGHYHHDTGRSLGLTNVAGTPSVAILQDFQGFDNGGDGLLRYISFLPGEGANGRIRSTVFSSPNLNATQWDLGGGGSHIMDGIADTGGFNGFVTSGDSRFTLDCNLKRRLIKSQSVTFDANGVATTPVSVDFTGVPGQSFEWSAQVSTTCGISLSATQTVAVPLPLVSMDFSDQRCSEPADPLVEGGAVFDLSRSYSNGKPLVVNLTLVSGSGDVSVPSTATFGAGDLTAEFNVTAINDDILETDEGFTIALATSANYDINSSADEVIGVVVSTIEVPPFEDDASSVMVAISSPPDTLEPQVVGRSINGSAYYGGGRSMTNHYGMYPGLFVYHQLWDGSANDIAYPSESTATGQASRRIAGELSNYYWGSYFQNFNGNEEYDQLGFNWSFYWRARGLSVATDGSIVGGITMYAGTEEWARWDTFGYPSMPTLDTLGATHFSGESSVGHGVVEAQDSNSSHYEVGVAGHQGSASLRRGFFRAMNVSAPFELTGPSSAKPAETYAVNSTGAAVGYYMSSGVKVAARWKYNQDSNAPTLSTLALPSGTFDGSVALSVAENVSGIELVAGYLIVDGGDPDEPLHRRAFVTLGAGTGSPVNLSVLPAGSSWLTLNEARDVNDFGWVVGFGINQNEEIRGFILVP